MKTKQVLQKIEYVMHSRFFLPACLVVAFVLRLAWVKVAHTELMCDWYWYYNRAIAFADGNGYSFNGVPTAYYPVGWPALLGGLFAIFGADVFVGQVANIVIYLGIIVISYHLAADLFRSKTVGALTALLLTVYPNHIAYSSMLISETLYTFLNLLGLLILIRSRHRIWMLIASGVVLGCAILTREQGYLVPLIAVIFFARRDKSLGLKHPWLRSGLILNLVVVLTVGCWTTRNYIAFKHFIPVSTNLGVNLWQGNNPHQNGGYYYGSDLLGTVRKDDSPADAWELDQSCRRHAINYIKQNPVTTLKWIPIRIKNVYSWDWDSLDWGTPQTRYVRLMRIMCKLFYYPLILVFAASMVTALVRRKLKLAYNFPTLGLWIAGYWLLGNAITYGYPRYHYAAMPLIIMYVAAFLCGAMFVNLKTADRINDTEGSVVSAHP